MASKALTKRIEPEHDRIRAVYARRSALDGRYSWFSSGHVYLMQERERRVLALLRRLGVDGLADRNILEIGCGTAHWLRDFIKWGASPERLVGVDLVADRVVEAKRLSPPGVTVTSGSAAALDLSNESMDVVIQSTVFTSILDASLRRQVASEMLRVLKPDGFILWYDFHVGNPRNPDVRGIDRREIGRLFPDCRLELHRITLAPPLLRAVASYSWLASYALASIPWLCTHYLGAIHKR